MADCFDANVSSDVNPKSRAFVFINEESLWSMNGGVNVSQVITYRVGESGASCNLTQSVWTLFMKSLLVTSCNKTHATNKLIL